MIANSALNFEKTGWELKKKLMYEKLRAIIVVLGLVSGSALIIYNLV